MATAKKQTATSEAVVGQAAVNFKKAVTEVKLALAGIDNLETKVEENQLRIAQQEAKIAELTVDYAERKRQADVDLAIRVKNDKAMVVGEVLNEEGKIAISKEELRTLENELDTLKRDFDEKVKKANSEAHGKAQGDLKYEKTLMEAEYKAKEAGNLSKIESLTDKVTFLEVQNQNLLDQMEAERKANVEKSKHSAIGSVNVTSGK